MRVAAPPAAVALATAVRRRVDPLATAVRRRADPLAWWVGVAVATVAVWAVLTWPFALHLDGIWTVHGIGERGAGTVAGRYRPDMLVSGDHLQNAFIQSVVVDNLRELRNPYLDLREGAAGPTPLRTTSLDVPWTAVVAVLWPLAGLQAAYNATLLLSTVATGLAAFAWLRRHTRWPLLAAAGALAYACTPNRMFQLTSHFNAVMWWAFPAALLAFEVMVQRWRAGGRWRGPAAALAAVTLTVAVGGEFHLILYLVGLLVFLALWWLVAGLLARRSGSGAGPRPPWAPVAVVAGLVAAGCAYVLAAFAYVFRGEVVGGNGTYEQVLAFAPGSAMWLVQRDRVMLGEGMIYVGWAVAVLAAVGLVAALAGRRPTARPYAVLLAPLLFLTLGPAADIGPVRPYRFAFDHLPLLPLQRVPQRLMVVTALVLVLLAVTALDLVGERLLAAPAWATRLAAAALLAGTALLLADYQFVRNVIMEDVAGNRVVTTLRAAGDRAGPILGVPIKKQLSPRNSVATYVAALGRRRTLNAYNQTPAPWLPERVRRLQPLNAGKADAEAIEELRATGTTQVVVVNEPSEFQPGEWGAVVDRLAASGRFRLVVADGPLALLELTGR